MKSSNRELPQKTIVTIYTIADQYERDWKDKSDKIGRFTFLKLLFAYFRKVSIAMIKESYHYRMPWLGTFYIKSIERDISLSIDYIRSRETGEKKHHLNRHTDGTTYKFKWADYIDFSEPIKYLYCWKATRGLTKDNVNLGIGKRGLAKYIKECANDPYKKDFSVIPLV